MTKLYQRIARTLQAIENCRQSGNSVWLDKHCDTLDQLEAMLPSGSGIDNGTHLDRDRSTPNKIVLTFGFHHMDENGYYDGWTDHTLTVRPSLAFGIDLKITGPNRNEIKDYLHETYHHALDTTLDKDYN